MTLSTFDRIAAAGGAAFSVLALSTVVVAPPAPAVDAPVDEIRRYLVDNHDRLGASIILMALAVIAISLFFAYVHRRLVDTDTGTALPAGFLIAGTTVVAMALAGVLLQGVLVQHTATGVDDSTLVLLHRTWNVIAFMGPPLPAAIVGLIIGARAVGGGVFPRWLGWVAVVSAVGGIATALMNLGTDHRAPAVLDFGSFLLSCILFTGLSVSAFVRRPTAVARESLVPAS